MMAALTTQRRILSFAARLAIMAGALLFAANACGGGRVPQSALLLADEAARFAAQAADDAARAAAIASADEAARAAASAADDAARTAASFADEAARAAAAADEAAALAAKVSAEDAARLAATAADEAVNIAAVFAKVDLDSLMSSRWASLIDQIEAYLGRPLTEGELSELAGNLWQVTCQTLKISADLNEQTPDVQLPVSLIFVPDLESNLLAIVYEYNDRFWSLVQEMNLDWVTTATQIGCEISDLP